MIVPFLVRNFWIVLIAITIANALIFRFRSRRHVARDPSLAEGYRKLFWGILVWGNISWIIVGIGCLVGGVPSIFSYFRPRDGNPFVLAFFASVFVTWGLGTYWLLLRGGAEMIVRHPGMMSVDVQNPMWVKLLWCLCLAGGITAAVTMFVADVPLPEVRR